MNTLSKGMLAWVFGILVVSCGPSLKTYDFGPFEITGPPTWEVIEVEGIDSYVRIILTEEGDTLGFDYGYYSNSLEENIPFQLSRKYINSLVELGIDTSRFFFYDVDTLPQEDYSEFLIQKTRLTQIDGFRAKIVTPKRIEEGITGVYFDSIRSGGIGNVRLNFLGRDLSQKDHEELLKALETIRFKSTN